MEDEWAAQARFSSNPVKLLLNELPDAGSGTKEEVLK
jgi:hypothetical protein